jgi:hypothetical protein
MSSSSFHASANMAGGIAAGKAHGDRRTFEGGGGGHRIHLASGGQLSQSSGGGENGAMSATFSGLADPVDLPGHGHGAVPRGAHRAHSGHVTSEPQMDSDGGWAKPTRMDSRKPHRAVNSRRLGP